jgi:hypothetical protein
MLQTGRSPVRITDEVDFFNLPILPVALWPWGRLSLPGGKKKKQWPARRADNLADIYVPNV